MKVGRQSDTAVSGALYGALSWLVPVLLSLAVTPQIVKGLRYESYGLYSLVMGFVGFSFNLNLSRALTRYIAEFRGGGDSARIPALVGTALSMAVALGALALTAAFTASDWYVSEVLRDEIHRQETVSGLWIGALIIVVLLINQVFTAVLQGHEAFRLFSWMSGGVAVATLLVNLLLVRSGFGFNALMMGTLAVTSLGVLCSALLASRLVEGRLVGMPEVGLFWSILGYSKFVVGYQVLGSVLLLAERSVISNRLGPEALTLYVLPMTVCLQFNGLITSASQFMIPRMSRQASAIAENILLYRAATRLVLFVGTLAAAVAYLHGENFLRLWIGDDVALGAGHAFFLLMLGFAFISLAVVSANTAEGLGRPSLNFAVTVGIVVVTFAFMLWPVAGSGIDAYAWARALGFAASLFGIPVIERLALGQIQLRFWIGAGAKMLTGACVFVGAAWAVKPLCGEGWLGLLLSVILSCAASSAWLWRLGYFAEVFEYGETQRSQ